MSNTSPFNVNPEVAAMKEDVAKRVFRLKTIEGVITLAALALAAVAAFTIVPALAAGGTLMASVGSAIMPLALSAAAGLGSYVTMKERKRLEIDEEFLQSRMQGRNWWNGYKTELGAEASGPLMSPSLPGFAPPGHGHGKN